MKKLSIGLISLLAFWTFYSPPSVQAECRALSSPETYTAGQVVRDTCDLHGTRNVTLTDSSGNPSTVSTLGATATGAAPTYTEGASVTLSTDLAGNTRMTSGTLLFGEDSTNNLMMVGPGATRITTFSSVASATTSLTQIVPIGVKTFMAYMGGASETKAFDLTIYGNWQNSTTGGRSVCRIWVPSTASVTHIEARCPMIEENFSYWYYTADVYTSASATNLTVYAMY